MVELRDTKEDTGGQGTTLEQDSKPEDRDGHVSCVLCRLICDGVRSLGGVEEDAEADNAYQHGKKEGERIEEKLDC